MIVQKPINEPEISIDTADKKRGIEGSEQRAGRRQRVQDIVDKTTDNRYNLSQSVSVTLINEHGGAFS